MTNNMKKKSNPLYDWLDEVEGKEPGTTTKAVEKEKARQGVTK